QPASVTDAAQPALPVATGPVQSAQPASQPVTSTLPTATGESSAAHVAPAKAPGTSGRGPGTPLAAEPPAAHAAGATMGNALAAKTPASSLGVMGWVAVKASVDVRVYANGRFLGTSTDEAYRLPEGTHEIHLVNER